MEALFTKIVELSLMGSLFVLAVFLLRLVFRNAPRWIFCLLWGLVALRLVIPVSIESGLSAVPKAFSDGEVLSELKENYVGDTAIIHQGAPDYDAAVDAGRQPVRGSDGGYYVVTREDSLEAPATVGDTVLPVLSWIWLAGVAAMAGYTLVSYILLKRSVAAATRLEGNIRQGEWVDSPFVLGFFRPVIYLPYGLSGADMDNVIAHEKAHISRKDHWWKPLGFVILSVYWFNPIMWLAYILLCRDIEAACDEKVIRGLDREGVKAYSSALLNCSVHRRRIAACPLAFGEVGVKERIKRVMHYKKPAFWLVLLVLIVSIVAAVLLLTAPVKEPGQVMGAYYRAAELLYTNKQEQTQVYSNFCVTGDYRLFAQKQDSEVWLIDEKLEKYPLTAEALRKMTGYTQGWHRDYTVTQIQDAYILNAENNYFYLVAKTKSGDTLLGFGGPDPEGNPGDSSLRYLYRLEPEMQSREVLEEFVAQSVLEEAGITQIIDIWESEENPGFMVAGFLAGYNYQTELGYDDMGYAIFQSDGTGYRLLSCEVYEDAVYSEGGILFCPGPAVLSLDGEATDSNSFDVILSCNGDLGKIQREYYQDDTMVMNMASEQTGSCSMHLFRWDLCEEANRVNQIYLDKEGVEIAVMTEEENILSLVDRIVNNPAVAASSNPYDYIKAKQEVYDELLSYGQRAVDCLIGYLRGTPDDGLREYIMAAACAELTGVGSDKSITAWGTARQWLDLYDEENGNFLGTPEDEIGSSLGIGSLLGAGDVWIQITDVQKQPQYPEVWAYSYRFFRKTSDAEEDLLTVENCILTEMQDYDGDGIVELFVQTTNIQQPYVLYDLENGEITSAESALVPDAVIDYEILFDWDGLYLYEEKWSWFLKDPQTYILELSKRPEERFIMGCPSGLMPEGVDPALVEAAYRQVNALLDGEITSGQKRLAYEILLEMELSYAPELISGADFNYSRLFEKWSYPYSGSSEEANCYEQMSVLFDGDPVAFLRGMAQTDESALTKELRLAAAWLAKTNYLHDGHSFAAVLDRLDYAASTDREREIATMFREEFEAIAKPELTQDVLLSGTSEALWDAFFYAPEQVMRELGELSEGQQINLGQKLWGAYGSWGGKLLDKGYAAVNRLLAQKPTGPLKDVAYEFLVMLELEGGYRDVYVPGQPFDYDRLFDKGNYADGALSDMVYTQTFAVFREDPAAFIAALTEWDSRSAEAYHNKESIARNFAYEAAYQEDLDYSGILKELVQTLTDQAEKACAELFLSEFEKITQN